MTVADAVDGSTSGIVMNSIAVWFERPLDERPRKTLQHQAPAGKFARRVAAID